MNKQTYSSLLVQECRDNSLKTIDFSRLVRRNQNTHKGDFGCIGIVGGNNMMFGALLLAGRAAMLSGCGKVCLGYVGSNHPVVDYIMPELMLGGAESVLANIHDYDVLVVGPGLGISTETIALVSNIIELQPKCVVVFDADALNIIAADNILGKKFWLLPSKIITPHPKEAARLLNIDVADVQINRLNAIKQLQNKYNSIVVLKGFGSLITDGISIYINRNGGSAMSNAGQGDTLCGIIAAFVAQGMDVFSAARFAVYIHATSSDDLVKTYAGYNGLTASLTEGNIRNILNRIIYSNTV